MNYEVPTQVITAFLEKLASLIWEGKGVQPKVSRDFFELYKDAFRQALEDGWKAELPIDWSSPDMLRLAVMEANVFRFACAKSDLLVQQLTKLARESNSFRDFRKAADALGQVYNKRYLETEYNFAQAVGQNGAKYQRHIKEKHIFPFVGYQTVGDQRVRYAHQILDGKIFEVGSAAYDLVAPPNGWGCRCEFNQITAEDAGDRKPVDPDQVKRMLESVKNGSTTEWKYMVKHGFNVNRGKIGEVFAEKEFYTNLKKKPGEAVVKQATEAKIPATFQKNFGKDFEGKNALPKDFWKYIPEGQIYNRVPSVKVRGGGDAYYLPTTKEIVLKKSNRWKASATIRQTTVVHETAHALHFDLKLITNTGIDATLKSKIKDDFYTMMLKDGGDLISIKQKFQKAKHWDNLRELQALDKFSHLSKDDLSDHLVSLADALLSVSVPNGNAVGYGHPVLYMARLNGAYMEAFAHVWENKWVGNPVFEHYFPTLYKGTVNLADEIITDLSK